MRIVVKVISIPKTDYKKTKNKPLAWVLLATMVASIFAIGLSVTPFAGRPHLAHALTKNPNSTVYSVIESADESLSYLGGSFSGLLSQTGGYGVRLTTTTALVAPPYASPNGTVRESVGDGSGGWYIAGDFSQVGGAAKPYLAHLAADGTLDSSFSPAPDNSVYTLVLVGATLYAGGDFSTIGGQSRSHLAALNATTGVATSWNPGANDRVKDLIVNAGTVYAAGSFTSFGGQTRNHLASVTTGSNNATAWNPDVDGFINAIVLGTGTIYAGGYFDHVGATTRNKIAEIDTTTGSATSWNPGANDQIFSVAVSATMVYLGGLFTTAGGSSRQYLAEINRTTGAATSWNPVPNNMVSTLLLNGTTLYVGGHFISVASTTRYRAAAFNTTTGVITAWNPMFDGSWNAAPGGGSYVENLAIDGSYTYASGDYTGVNLELYNGLVRVNNNTGNIDSSWSPPLDVGSTVYGIVRDDTYIYVAGDLQIVGVGAASFAVFDLVTGSYVDWGLTFDSIGYDIALHNNILYVVGPFSTVNGQARNRIVAISTLTQTLTGFSTPAFDSSIYSVTADDTGVYVGGYFIDVGGTTRNKLAKFNLTTGALLSWNPDVNSDPDNDYVDDVYAQDGLVYVGGYFNHVGSSVRNYATAVDGVTGAVTAFNPDPDGEVQTIYPYKSGVFLGGYWFTTVGGVGRSNFALVNKNDGSLLPLVNDTDAFGNINTFVGYGNNVAFGGRFTSVNSASSRYYGASSIPVISFVDATTSGLETVSNPNFTLAVSAPVTGDTTVTYAVTGGTATGGGVDYTLADGTAVISNGQTSVDIPFTVTDDFIVESDETITLSVISVDNALFDNGSYTYTIQDNEVADFTIDISEGTNLIEGTGSKSFAIALSAQPADDVTVSFTPDADLMVNLPSVVFTSANWDTPRTIIVQAVNNNSYVGDRSANVAIAASSTDPDFDGKTSTIGYSIREDEGAPVGPGGGGTPVIPSVPHARQEVSGSISIVDKPTSDPRVTVVVSASPLPQFIELTNNPSQDNWSRLPYASALTWNICTSQTCPPGLYTITARFVDFDNNVSSQVSDNVMFVRQSTPLIETTEQPTAKPPVQAIQPSQADTPVESFPPRPAPTTHPLGNNTQQTDNQSLLSQKSPTHDSQKQASSVPVNAPESAVVTTDEVSSSHPSDEVSRTQPWWHALVAVFQEINRTLFGPGTLITRTAENDTPAANWLMFIFAIPILGRLFPYIPEFTLLGEGYGFKDMALAGYRNMLQFATFIGVRKRREYWGTVYDSVSKQPLDPVIVKLVNVANGTVMQTAITDMAGRFGFLTAPGKYTLIAEKTHYAFPSTKETGDTDLVFDRLYHGEVFELSASNPVVSPNIPMDPLAADWNQQDKQRIIKFHPWREMLVRWFYKALFALGMVLTLGSTYIHPTGLGITVSIIYTITLIYTWLRPPQKLWGQLMVGRSWFTKKPARGYYLELQKPNLPVVFGKSIVSDSGKFFLKTPQKGVYDLIVKASEKGAVITRRSIRTNADGLITGNILI